LCIHQCPHVPKQTTYQPAYIQGYAVKPIVELLHIPSANALTCPRAMVVHIPNTHIAKLAMRNFVPADYFTNMAPSFVDVIIAYL
jgi:hypothetical protein